MAVAIRRRSPICASRSWMYRPDAFSPACAVGAPTCARPCARVCEMPMPSPAPKMPRRRHPPLVILCDISGPMSRYSRLALHFVHAITNDRDRVHLPVRDAPHQHHPRSAPPDVDVALDKVADRVEDWSGGTRIGHCLASSTRPGRAGFGPGRRGPADQRRADRTPPKACRRKWSGCTTCRRLIWLNLPLLLRRLRTENPGRPGDDQAC